MSELRPKYLEAVRDGLGVSGISGDMKAGGGVWLGDQDQQPEAAGTLHLDGSIQKSEAIGCRVLRLTDQSIPNATWTAIQFSTVQKNDFVLWVIGSPANITIDRPGFYQAAGCVCLDGAGVRCTYGLRLLLNGVVVAETLHAISAGLDPVLNVCGVFWCDEQDIITLEAWQDSGGAMLALGLADYSSTLGVVRVA